MTIHQQPTLVLLDPHTAAGLPDLSGRLAHLDHTRLVALDYADLARHRDHLITELAATKGEMLLFTSNDQVFERHPIGPTIRALRAGYTTVSGIDRANTLEQSAECIMDYVNGRGDLLDLPEPPPSINRIDLEPTTPTFSLVFDTEQLGGVKYGVGRILRALRQVGARATFYVTSIMAELYPDLLPTLTAHGHEIAPHGACHEYYSGLPLEQQRAKLADARSLFELSGPVRSANLIYRMDHTTLEALAAEGYTSFVLYAEHSWKPVRYIPRFTRPLEVLTGQGALLLAPVGVETYGRSWRLVKRRVESVLALGEATGWPHLTALLHPFRDGALHHLDDLHALLHHLTSRGYRGVPLTERLDALPGGTPQVAAADLEVDPLAFHAAPQPVPPGVLPGLGGEGVGMPRTPRDVAALPVEGGQIARNRLRRMTSNLRG